jgi:hypothetical protein
LAKNARIGAHDTLSPWPLTGCRKNIAVRLNPGGVSHFDHAIIGAPTPAL